MMHAESVADHSRHRDRRWVQLLLSGLMKQVLVVLVLFRDQATKPWHRRTPLTIMVDGQLVETVNSFVYLGCLQSSDGYSCPDISQRIGLAWSVMSSLSSM